mmetsp:Transcript_3743/g.7830  ORF Transcript_3743/g.7830 Transcript_3743/m.7830 type:complete len:81 (-) Transcript_3743:1565-1807(-)
MSSALLFSPKTSLDIMLKWYCASKAKQIRDCKVHRLFFATNKLTPTKMVLILATEKAISPSLLIGKYIKVTIFTNAIKYI